MGPAAARYFARCLEELVPAEQRLMWPAVLIRLEVSRATISFKLMDATINSDVTTVLRFAAGLLQRRHRAFCWYNSLVYRD